ncbi:MAG TPA: PAS domain-containing protein, partial [Kiloniellaceae bacterium]|nr:PAS domain-containing protein [Kiloniellaceae bacterium]
MDSAVSLDRETAAPADWPPPGLAVEALEALPVAVAIAVRAGPTGEPLLIYGNQAFGRVTGCRPSPDHRRRLSELMQVDRDAAEEQRVRDHLAAGQPVSETLWLRGGEAGAVVCEWTPLAQSFGGERCWSLALTCPELVEREAVERLLLRSAREAAHSRALLLEAIESMTDGLVWFDNDGRLLLCNQKYRDLYPKLADDLKVGASYL